jgi:hypothetical protein
MKRNSLTTAVVAGIAGTVGIANLASAVTLNPDGLGQVLVYPYYTVNVPNNEASSNLTTQFAVVNTTDQGKAVKVRFLEGRNSREVRDFNLYLSPYDVWTAVVFKLPEEEQANLLTADTSCTVPKIRTADGGASSGAIGVLPDGRKFVRFTNQLFVNDTAYGASGGAARSLANTREGHFEIIEMGVVGNNAGQTGDPAQNSIAAITHNPATGVPVNCQKVVNAWGQVPQGYWTADGTVDLNPATGGLFGSAAIVDVDNGTMLSYSPDAVDGFWADGGFTHTRPEDTRPSIGVDIGQPNATATAFVFQNGQVVTATYGAGIAGTAVVDAFSALFTYDAIMNEYVLGGGAAASTDWALTFPTKGFYVDPARVATARAPFVERFSLAGAGQGSCVEVQLTPFDREERGPGACTGSDAGNPACDICFSPCEDPEAFVPTLCFETQVISFQSTADYLDDETSPVLGSALAANVDTRADNLSNGWLRIGLNPLGETHALPASAEGVIFFGLPVTGFAATNFVNANAQPGQLANYSGLWKHKGSRNCSTLVPGGGTGACS